LGAKGDLGVFVAVEIANLDVIDPHPVAKVERMPFLRACAPVEYTNVDTLCAGMCPLLPADHVGVPIAVDIGNRQGGERRAIHLRGLPFSPVCYAVIYKD